MNKWFLLPGMGATSAMYSALRHKVDCNIDFVNWPAYDGEKTYAEVARRVVEENKIEKGDLIGGSSLGGMIALEISRVIQPRAVILLGSAVKAGEVQHMLALLAPLAVITPIAVVQLLAGKQKNLVSSMFAETDTEFIRSMCAYLPHWQGYSGPMADIYRLHGAKDQIIPCPPSGAEVVDDAGHLLAMTHASETAAFLRRVKDAAAR